MDLGQLLLALLGGGGLGAVLAYFTSRHQLALEREGMKEKVEEALWTRTQKELASRDKRIDDLVAENEKLWGENRERREETARLRSENEEMQRELTAVKVENDTLRQANAALKEGLQLARSEQDAANKRHMDSLNELLMANSALERELRDVRGRMRRVEAGETGPLSKS